MKDGTDNRGVYQELGMIAQSVLNGKVRGLFVVAIDEAGEVHDELVVNEEGLQLKLYEAAAKTLLEFREKTAS